MYMYAQLLILEAVEGKTSISAFVPGFFGIPFAYNLTFAYMASILGGRPKNFL